MHCISIPPARAAAHLKYGALSLNTHSMHVKPDAPTDAPAPTPDEHSACSLANWYAQFEKITVRTISIPIPADALEYLRDDLFVLPAECDVGAADQTPSFGAHEPDDDDDISPPTFVGLSDRLRAGIAALGGSAFIKTDRTAPKDAFWITAGQTLRCRDITDAYQLLKASVLCRQDLGRRTDAAPTIHLRRWTEIHPGTEFRCYVLNRRLIAISPRDWPQYHSYIAQQEYDIITDICTTFDEHIRTKFPLRNYCFDVVREKKDHVWLVDFSPYGPQASDELAFSWSELDALDAESAGQAGHPAEFRYIPNEIGIQPSSRNNYGIPRDVIEVYQTADTASDPSGTVSLDVLLGRLMQQTADDDRTT